LYKIFDSNKQELAKRTRRKELLKARRLKAAKDSISFKFNSVSERSPFCISAKQMIFNKTKGLLMKKGTYMEGFKRNELLFP
jgi:hypothetical protein